MCRQRSQHIEWFQTGSPASGTWSEAYQMASACIVLEPDYSDTGYVHGSRSIVLKFSVKPRYSIIVQVKLTDHFRSLSFSITRFLVNMLVLLQLLFVYSDQHTYHYRIRATVFNLKDKTKHTNWHLFIFILCLDI